MKKSIAVIGLLLAVLFPAGAQTVTLEIAQCDAPAHPTLHVEGWNVAEKVLK